MRSDREIWYLFSDSSFVGDVLRKTTQLEFDLDAVLTQYFIRSDRFEAAMELLLPELTFGRKIDLLTHLPLRKSLLSYGRAIEGLRKFQRIRNIVAHSPHVSFSTAKKLARDGNYKRLLHDYPEGLLAEFGQTARSLIRLLRVREFQDPSSGDVVDHFGLFLRQWLE